MLEGAIIGLIIGVIYAIKQAVEKNKQQSKLQQPNPQPLISQTERNQQAVRQQVAVNNAQSAQSPAEYANWQQFSTQRTAQNQTQNTGRNTIHIHMGQETSQNAPKQTSGGMSFSIKNGEVERK